MNKAGVAVGPALAVNVETLLVSVDLVVFDLNVSRFYRREPELFPR